MDWQFMDIFHYWWVALIVFLGYVIYRWWFW
jgi:hypothetical protein